MQSSSQSAWCLPNLHKFQLPADGRRTRDIGRLPTADYWSWLLYEDWPETRFRSRPITRGGHRATCNFQNFHFHFGRAGPGRLLWAAVRCNYVVQLISTQREAAVVRVVGRRVGKGDKERVKGLPMCSVCICALCRGHLCNLLSLMAFNVPRQVEPSQVGPPVVHWPFGRSLKLMQKLFDRFAIRRKNAKQTSGSGGQAMHQSSCQYDNICIHMCVSVCVCMASARCLHNCGAQTRNLL